MIRNLYLDMKEKIYRTTSILFIVQLFGALGAGFFFVIQNLFGSYHIFGLTGAENEPILWFILFWATDFYFIAMSVVLSYLIAGIPAIAPSLALSIYFCHFADVSADAVSMYPYFFGTPANYSNSTAIGYMGYLIMSVMLSLLIKLLYAGWSNAKNAIGAKIDNLLFKLKKNIKFISDNMKGIEIIEGVDLIVLILIIPVASAATTFMLIKYGIEVPFSRLAAILGDALANIADSNIALAAIVMGLMVGVDLIGPISLAAFSVAVASYFVTGNAQLITIYSVCFITVAWTAFFSVLCCKIFKKGGITDTNDFNLATTGPINAFFENIKLTVAPSMPLAMRSPFTYIPGFMFGSSVAALITALAGIVNTAYADGTLPKFTTENYTYGSINYTYAELFERGEIYMSFTLPLRSGDFLSCRLPLFFIIIFSGIAGGLVVMFLRQIEYKLLTKRNCYYEPNGDIVLEMREFGKKLSEQLKMK